MLNDHIYAVGGFDGSCGLNTAEVISQIFNCINLLNVLGNGINFELNRLTCQKVLDMSVGGTHLITY